MQTSNPDRQWQLVAQHPSGSIGSCSVDLPAEESGDQPGITFGFGGSLVLVFSVARRAERFARLQMEFVAGVSHELCTPLAVINSAVENLADGVVENRNRLKSTQGFLRDQGGRLEKLLDQVLLFASGKVERARKRVALSRRGAGGGAERRHVRADTAGCGIHGGEEDVGEPAAGKSRSRSGQQVPGESDQQRHQICGQNHWLGVRAQAVNGTQKPEVQVSVEDKGRGIPAEDLPHIFEPFYRVQEVRETGRFAA